MKSKRHKTKWTWISMSGGYLYFNTRGAAVSHALQYGGFGIFAPLYGDE